MSADDELAYPREAEYLVLARVLVAQGLPGRALALLERMHAAAVGQGRVGCVIETGTLRALALAAIGEEDRAIGVLAAARSRSATPKGTYGSSLTRASRCAPCSAGSLPVSAVGMAPSATSRPATWPGSGGPS